MGNLGIAGRLQDKGKKSARFPRMLVAGFWILVTGYWLMH
jgi:hypothetical protein